MLIQLSLQNSIEYLCCIAHVYMEFYIFFGMKIELHMYIIFVRTLILSHLQLVRWYIIMSSFEKKKKKTLIINHSKPSFM